MSNSQKPAGIDLKAAQTETAAKPPESLKTRIAIIYRSNDVYSPDHLSVVEAKLKAMGLSRRN